MYRLIIMLVLTSHIAYSQDKRLYQNKGNKFNPSIGVNSLFLFKNDSVPTTDEGFSIQEMELQFVSDVDSNFMVNALIAIRKEAGEFIIEPEEAFLETTSIKDITFRVGKFRMALGKHNQLHTHAYPFVDAPLTQASFLGDEGLQEVGGSLAYLVPLPWYTEVRVQAVQGENEDLFNPGGGKNTNNYAYLGRLVNFLEVTDHSTLELSFSGLTGRNDNDPLVNPEDTHLLGADLTYKWKPSKNQSFLWSTEYLQRQKETLESGIFSYIQYQIAPRWYLGARYDKLGITEDDGTDISRGSFVATFASSEFAAIRAQYNYVDDKSQEINHQVMVQFNMSIGAHPAHRY